MWRRRDRRNIAYTNKLCAIRLQRGLEVIRKETFFNWLMDVEPHPGRTAHDTPLAADAQTRRLGDWNH